MNRVFFGDCRDTMRKLIADGVRVQMCVTSPPYYGLRDYGHPGQLGLEETPAEYVAAMVEVFALVRELLTDDGDHEVTDRNGVKHRPEPLFRKASNSTSTTPPVA